MHARHAQAAPKHQPHRPVSAHVRRLTVLLLGAMLAGLLPRPALAVAPAFADAVSVPLGSSADKMATGDINNDGKPDLVVATGGVTVRINTTAPGSATPTYGTATEALTANPIDAEFRAALKGLWDGCHLACRH